MARRQRSTRFTPSSSVCARDDGGILVSSSNDVSRATDERGEGGIGDRKVSRT